jgi:4a-hydroxytetrahydrobiopterin dehydratase
MTKLTDPEIRQRMASLPGWKFADDALIREYTFLDFAAAFGFVTRLALMAEKANHHPDIDIRYNRVRLALISHDSGGVTARDIGMANEINKI